MRPGEEGLRFVDKRLRACRGPIKTKAGVNPGLFGTDPLEPPS
jgi:hypothetical protein